MTDTNSTFDFVYDTVPLEPGVLYHVVLAQAAGAPMLRAEVFMNGQLYTALPGSFSTNFTDFRVDAISISSYHDPGSGGSILAHGVVDNLIVTTPPPPVQNLSGAWSNNIWQARCISRSNWLYTLQRTADFQSWTDVSTATTGNATNLLLPDANPPAGTAFYRMKAERP